MTSTRREFLKRVAAGSASGLLLGSSAQAVTGSDATWTDDNIAALRAEGFRVDTGEDVLSALAEDFGHLVKGSSRAIAYPFRSTDIRGMVNFAARKKLQFTMRGAGHSQSGHSIGRDNVTMKFTKMDRISVNINENTVTAQPGAMIRNVAEASYRHKMTPVTLPLYLDLTIGGLLSVGGIGASSHKFGPLVSNVLELEVVTGSGEIVTCSPAKNGRLFESVLAGLGRCGAITSATTRLRPVKPFVRTFYLLYDDVGAWVNDQRTLVRSGTCDYLEGFCTASEQGLRSTSTGRRPFAHWFYGLYVSYEYDNPARPPDDSALSGLQHYKHVHTEDEGSATFPGRYDTRFATMFKTGASNLPHPVFECLLPVSRIPDVLPVILDALPLTMGDGHRLMFISKHNLPKFFVTPPEEEIACFAVHPTGVPTIFLEEALKAVETIHAIAMEAGGKRYLPGWLGMMDKNAWKHHYGPLYDDFLATEKRFDPDNVFSSVLLSSAITG